jgi:hypothetical protein
MEFYRFSPPFHIHHQLTPSASSKSSLTSQHPYLFSRIFDDWVLVGWLRTGLGLVGGATEGEEDLVCGLWEGGWEPIFLISDSAMRQRLGRGSKIPSLRDEDEGSVERKKRRFLTCKSKFRGQFHMRLNVTREDR